METKRLPNRRRCHSTPPWSLPDVSSGFYRRNYTTERLHVNTPMFEPFKTIHLWGELPMSTLMLLDGRFVLKMVPITWDIHTIVHNMQVAGSVVRVPRVHSWGRSGNSCYMLMDYVKGFCFDTVIKKYGHFGAMRLEREIADIVDRLAAVGLSHGDLHPRNVMVDEYYNVLAVLDWDYATRIERAGDEYFRRICSRLPDYPGLPPYSEGDEAWDSCFLRHAWDRADAFCRPCDFLNARVPPASLSWLTRPGSALSSPEALNPPIARIVPRDLRRRVALLVSGSDPIWAYTLEALRSNTSLNVCLVVVDDHQHVATIRSTAADAPWSLMHPDRHVPQHRFPAHDNELSSVFDADLADALAKARAHAVILCHWPHRLQAMFWAMVAVPPLLSQPQTPVAVLRIDSLSGGEIGTAGLSLSLLSNSTSPLPLSKHVYSADELQPGSARTRGQRDFACRSASSIGKLLQARR